MTRSLHDDYDSLNDFAHDLKTPLGTIKSCLELVGRLGETNKRQEEFIERGLGAVERIESMVANLLEYARLGNDHRIVFEVCNLSKILQDVVDAVYEPARHNEISIEIDLDEIPDIEANATLLHSLFLNLLTNAVKYNQAGGYARLEARMGADTTPEHVVIKVIDNGMGIPDEAQSRIYDRFYRVNPKEHHAIDGVGLGLAIVRRVVDLHHATLTLDSELGRGTTFIVTLPIKQNKANEGVPPPHTE